MTDLPYTVVGKWPFPLDMLRKDQARAADARSQMDIDAMSKDIPDVNISTTRTVRINLIMEAGEPTKHRPAGRLIPNHARWRSFGWDVEGVPEIDQMRAAEQAVAAKEALRRSGLAKLTAEEKEALGL